MLGPLGIRCNQWMGGCELHSPSQRDFTWERVVWATCYTHNCKPLGLKEPFFEEYPEVLDIRENCWCGIYSTTLFDTAKMYIKDVASAVFVLVECLGTVWIHGEGFRSSGVQIAKVVDATSMLTYRYTREQLNLYSITARATAKSYSVGIIDWDTAKVMIDAQFNTYMDMEEEEKSNEPDTRV